MQCRPISADWLGEPVIVAASGPSLTPEIATRARWLRWLHGWRVLVVNDAHRLMPWADLLYAADWSWWKTAAGAPGFRGERWTCHSTNPGYCDDKSAVAGQFDLRLVAADDGRGFSMNPDRIHYGSPGSSGFQALNLAILKGARKIVLIGFDMRVAEGRTHFYGVRNDGLRVCSDAQYRDMTRAYGAAPDGVQIINASTGSALTVYPAMSFDDATDDSLHRHRAVADASAD